MLGKLLQPEINELIAERSFLALKEVLATLAPADIADVIEDVELEDRAILFRLLAVTWLLMCSNILSSKHRRRCSNRWPKAKSLPFLMKWLPTIGPNYSKNSRLM